MQKKKLEVYHEHEEHHIDRSIAIIGSGNMGSALLKGIIHAKLAPPKKITACDINEAKLKILANEWKIKTTTDIQAAVQASDIVLLCVKPQTLSKALQAIKSVIRSDQLVISIVAGMRIAYIQQMLGERIAIVRTMPNIAATVDEGAAALAFGEHVSPAQQKIAISIFEAVGDVVTVSEDQLDAVTGLSGSGPAYIYMVIEALIDGGVKMGLSREISTKLSVQTVLGSATLVKKSGLHPAILRDQVTTPGGTTINAIHELESHGLRSMLIDAVAIATKRSEELSKIMNKVS